MSLKTLLLSYSRRHIQVFDEDWEFLEKHFGMQSRKRIGAGTMCRNIIHVYVKKIRANAQAQLDQKDPPDDD